MPSLQDEKVPKLIAEKTVPGHQYGLLDTIIVVGLPQVTGHQPRDARTSTKDTGRETTLFRSNLIVPASTWYKPQDQEPYTRSIETKPNTSVLSTCRQCRVIKVPTQQIDRVYVEQVTSLLALKCHACKKPASRKASCIELGLAGTSTLRIFEREIWARRLE